MSGPKYTEQYKQNAVDLAVKLKNCGLAARKLNIPEGTLQKWVRKYKQNQNEVDPQLSLAIQTSGELSEKIDFYIDLFLEFLGEIKRFKEECEEIFNQFNEGRKQ